MEGGRVGLGRVKGGGGGRREGGRKGGMDGGRDGGREGGREGCSINNVGALLLSCAK